MMKLYDCIIQKNVWEMASFLAKLVAHSHEEGMAQNQLRSDYETRIAQWLLQEVHDGQSSPLE